MDVVEVHRLVDRVVAVDDGCADPVVLRAAVVELRRLRSWLEGCEVALARAAAGVSSYPEKTLAEAAGSTLRQAEQVVRRTQVAEQVPVFGASLQSGKVTGEHVDALGRVLRQLSPDSRSKLAERGESLLAAAETSTADEFARTLRREVRRLESERDGEARLQRQRRAIRLTGWIDHDTRRLASADQRRALHAIYPRCAIPGGQTRYSRTRLHHVRCYTRDHGPTDLATCFPSASTTTNASTTTTGY